MTEPCCGARPLAVPSAAWRRSRTSAWRCRRQPERADRPQRRRQDDALRPGVGLPQARRGQRRFDGRGHHRPRAAPQRAARHDAHLPDRAALRRADGAREHRRRRAPAPRAVREALRRGRRGRAAGRPRAAARQAGRRPDGGRPQAAGAGARAGHPAAPAAARRSAGGPEPAGDGRDGAGGARHRRRRRHGADDRARDAGGDAPRRACVGAGAGPADRRRARRREVTRDAR